MPTTKKESFYFGLMMCFGMVVVMTFYNLFINGLIGIVPFKGILIQLMLGFIIAFLLELFIVGPAAQKIAFSLPYDKSKKLFEILSISFFMVVGMVLFMSLYGLVTAYFFNSLTEESLLKSYYSIAFKNLIFAFPLQLIIMGPFVRYLFTKFVKGQRIMESGSIS
ncbi:MAG: hypothetical protein ACQEWV_14135 [Bacillota bacterium]